MTVAREINVKILGGQFGRYRPGVHRTQPERLIDDATACLKDGRIYVELIERRPSIHIFHPGGGTPDLYVRRGVYGCVVGGGQPGETLVRYRTWNDGEPSLVQIRKPGKRRSSHG